MTVEFLVSAFVECFSDLRHEIVIEIEIMKHGKTHTEHFVCLEKMTDIAARIESAGGALTIGVDRQRIALIFLVVDVHRTLPGEDIAVARVSRGHNAVKEVNASVYRLQNVDGRTDTHQITRLVLGHKGLNGLDDMIHDFRFFADGKTAERIAGEIEFGDTLHMVDTDIVIRTALVDTEEHLIFIDGFGQGIESCHFVLTTRKPTGRAVNGCLHVIAGRGIFDAFVKRHRNGRRDVGLDLHAFLRSHKNTSAVYVRCELYAFLTDLAELREGEYLKAAAIRQNGSVPIEKLVDAAHIADNVVTRTNVEMVGIGELDLTADLIKILFPSI